MKTVVALLTITLAGLLWMRHENERLSTAWARANLVASEQKTTIATLSRQLAVVTSRAEKNERAQAELRQKLNAAADRQAQREQTIRRLLNDDEDFRRWYRTALPDAVRRVHQRAACASAGDCLPTLPKGRAVSDAGK